MAFNFIDPMTGQANIPNTSGFQGQGVGSNAMQLPFWPLMIGNALLGAGQGAFGAYEGAQQQAGQRAGAAVTRAQIEQLIKELENPNYDSMTQAASQNFDKAAGQIDAQSAAHGIYGAGKGGADYQKNAMLSQIIAQLSQAQGQDMTQRHQIIANLLQNPAFQVPREGMDPTLAGILGFFGGAFGGGAQGLGSLMGSKSGLESLMSLGQPSPTVGAM